MPITIYNNSSDKKVIGKTLTSVSTENYVLLDDCSIISPKMILSYASNILTANYAYIAEFNRYYFIDNITILSARKLQLDMSIDVLETYKVQIKAMTCIVKRNANLYNLYLDDPYFQSQNKRQMQFLNFSGGEFSPSGLSASTDCYVLTVAQGGTI